MEPIDPALDLVWGLEAISKLIGRSVRQTHYMLSTGKLPAKQVGERWVTSRSKLVAFFLEDAA
ncbi:DNA-binding protein [Rhizobium sp. TH2]|uniref:DNA-binding protein n=1 Tax=Rhizobium sp. TH2 TaxID=2775403 RepID=UPI002157FE91|nr:DNA-binding protein [Rhizobium sp. TH2]UVC08259.1 DNA-binding protein [Rhizobium sp. TH2]